MAQGEGSSALGSIHISRDNNKQLLKESSKSNLKTAAQVYKDAIGITLSSLGGTNAKRQGGTRNTGQANSLRRSR